MLEGYKSGEAEKLLGLSRYAFADLRKKGVLSYYQTDGGHTRYNKEYIDELAALWAGYMQELGPTCDTTFFRLCSLQWEHNHPPADCAYNSKEGARYRKQIKQECDRLVAAGQAYTVKLLAEAVGKNVQAVSWWASRKKIVAVRIGQMRYLSARYAKHIIAPFAQLVTIAEITDKTGLSEGVVTKKLRQGDVPGVLCIDGLWRASPEVIPGLVRPQVDDSGSRLLTIKDAAARLNVDAAVLRWEMSQNRVYTVGEQATVRIPESEVVKWQERFAHLNPEFAWLEPVVMPRGVKPRTMEPKIVMKELKLSAPALTEWSKAGVLPFFVWSFTDATLRERRVFVRRYILGLRKFAGNLKPDLRIARRYLKLCRNNSQIM